jgi:hypothetical protein
MGDDKNPLVPPLRKGEEMGRGTGTKGLKLKADSLILKNKTIILSYSI